MASKQVRLTFDGDEVKRPLIYEMGHEFGIVTNIRMADVDIDTGWVVLEVIGETEEIVRCLDWVRSHGVRVDDATLGDVVEG